MYLKAFPALLIITLASLAAACVPSGESCNPRHPTCCSGACSVVGSDPLDAVITFMLGIFMITLTKNETALPLSTRSLEISMC